MLTKEQILEIRRLREQGLSISQIAKQKNVDWKTAKKYSAWGQGNAKKNSESNGRQNSSPDENDLEKIVQSWNAWEEPFEKYFDWHQKRAIKGLAGFAWIRMGSCANLVNNDVECRQNCGQN